MADKSENGRRKPDVPEDQDEPATTAQPPEFEHFDGLLRKLIRVPKAELDAKRKDSQR
jgi:hypothetical protein